MRVYNLIHHREAMTTNTLRHLERDPITLALEYTLLGDSF
jgi:hypothetical protein